MQVPVLKTPDFTPESITALVSTLLGDVYILFGTSIPETWKAAITGIASTLVLVAFLFHSAKIRSARAAMHATMVAAAGDSEGGALAPD